MSKTINTYWFSSLEGSYGIVTTDNGYRKKAYIGGIDVTDSEEDSELDIKNAGKNWLENTMEICIKLY